MSKSKRTPQYRRQKRKGRPDLAFVEFAGQRMYIGEFGTVESRANYVRIIREWEIGGGHAPVPSNQITVTEVLAAFWP